jgi:hypothetical protein
MNFTSFMKIIVKTQKFIVYWIVDEFFAFLKGCFSTYLQPKPIEIHVSCQLSTYIYIHTYVQYVSTYIQHTTSSICR